jgi:hypothetical protein
MNAKVKSLLTAMFMVLGLATFQVQSAAAYQAGGNLPAYKEPPSVRFDIKGSLSVSAPAPTGNTSILISGSGAMAGSNFQEDVTVNLPANSSSGGFGLTSATTSLVLIDKMFYFKVSGLPSGAGGGDKWYVMDLSKVPGGQTTLPGMGGSGLTGLDPKYQDALHTTQLGKETINGASTTKYQVDVDLQKLLALMGSSDPQTAQVLGNAKLVVYMWIGDDDIYVHQTRAVLDLKTSVPNSSDITLSMDFLITYKDFGAPITITAPADAQPIDLGANASSTAGSLLLGMPSSFVMSGMASAMPTGMPKTGSSHQDLPLIPLALGLTCLTAGALLRKRAALVR